MLKQIFQLLLLFAMAAAAHVRADDYDQDCLPLKIEGRHGPFDYRSASQAERKLVEGSHFDEHYQAYKLGKKKLRKRSDSIIETPAAGFGYTLWAFPNHHMALVAIEDLGSKQKSERLDGLQLRVHCYFQRAVRFVPNDGLVRALYGYYYARRNEPAKADIQIAEAINHHPDNVNVRVYSATAYLEMGQPEKAAEHVKAAYAAGYPFPGLRQRLEKAGQSLN
jgi:predicted Zn-dependent protease